MKEVQYILVLLCGLLIIGCATQNFWYVGQTYNRWMNVYENIYKGVYDQKCWITKTGNMDTFEDACNWYIRNEEIEP